MSASLAAASLVAQVERRSAPVTDLAERLAWTAGILTLLVLVYLLMLRGWRRRAARQSDVPPLPSVPTGLPAAVAAAQGSYVSTTTSGDWLDRIVARGLGVPSGAQLAVHDDGVLLDRDGAPTLWMPRAAVRGARLERGMAGKFVERDGLFVITWAHGGRLLDTGFRARDRMLHDDLLDAVATLAPTGPGAATPQHRGGAS
jgi:hypothetical protein